MSNSSNVTDIIETSGGAISREVLIAASYIPVAIMVLGVVGNSLSFLIFTFHPSMNKYSSMVYLSFIAITDTIGLFEWNLDHFIRPNYGLQLETMGSFGCKVATFFQYFSMQSSGFLYSFISVDRFFMVVSKPGSLASKLPFGTRRSAAFWSIGITSFVFIYNIHSLINLGVTTTSTPIYNETAFNIDLNDTSNATIIGYKISKTCEGYYFKAWPLSDFINMALYSFVPFVIMAITNTLLIIEVLFKSKSKVSSTNNSKSSNRKLKMTVSLIVITCAFILMTIPGTIGFTLFSSQLFNGTPEGYATAIFLDSMMFLQQTMLFIISFLTNKTFSDIVKNFVLEKIFCRKPVAATNEATKSTVATKVQK